MDDGPVPPGAASGLPGIESQFEPVVQAIHRDVWAHTTTNTLNGIAINFQTQGEPEAHVVKRARDLQRLIITTFDIFGPPGDRIIAEDDIGVVLPGFDRNYYVFMGFTENRISSRIAEECFADEFAKAVSTHFEGGAVSIELYFGLPGKSEASWTELKRPRHKIKMLRRDWKNNQTVGLSFSIHVPCMEGRLYLTGKFNVASFAGQTKCWTHTHVNGNKLWFQYNATQRIRRTHWYTDMSIGTSWVRHHDRNSSNRVGYCDDSLGLLGTAFAAYHTASTRRRASLWTAEYDYAAADWYDLSFNKGDLIAVSKFVEDTDFMWAIAVNVALTADTFGQRGSVPSNYLEMEGRLKAITAYNAGNEYEVSFRPTDTLAIRRLDVDAGTVEVTNFRTNESGTIPLNTYLLQGNGTNLWTATAAHNPVSDDGVPFQVDDTLLVHTYDWENMTATATVMRTDKTGTVPLSHVVPFPHLWKTVRKNPSSFTDLAWKPVGDGQAFGHAIIPYTARNIKPSGVQVAQNGAVRDCGEADAISMEPFRPGDHIVNRNGTAECYTATNAWRWMHGDGNKDNEHHSDPLTRRPWGDGWK